MFTRDDILDAYYAYKCEMFAEADEITPEQAASGDTEIYSSNNELDIAATKAARQVEIDRLHRGQAILKTANLVIGDRQQTQLSDPTFGEPAVFVPAGYLATVEMFRQISLISDGFGTYFTPAEIAERTGTAESGWRNKAAAGLIPGAIKKGKQWLIPQNAVK